MKKSINFFIFRYLPYVPGILFILAYICALIEFDHWLKDSSNKALSKKDCMIAEISPDFSVKEKEFCRDLRMKK